MRSVVFRSLGWPFKKFHHNKYEATATFKSFKICQKYFHSSNEIRTARKSRWLAKFSAVSVIGAPALYYFLCSPEERISLKTNLEGVVRFLRSLRIGVTVSMDYWWSLRGIAEDSEAYESTMKGCHQRSAERILEGCLKNGGLFVKLGQGMCQMNHILPPEYMNTLCVLYDKALTRKEYELDQLFMQDFGCLPEQMFQSFDRQPIAAASLAQVFKATTSDGKQVAVKVQYIDLRSRFNGDCNTAGFMVRLIKLMHPDFNFVWILNEMRATLVKELDFVNEAHNMERCASELSHLKFVYVPKVHWDKTTERVLTMEYIEGPKVSDTKEIQKLGLNLSDVDEKLVKAFAEQIFYTGFVHADPHPGNVLIRKDLRGKAEVVLLDHGLYEFIDDEIRNSLCQLWKSIILNNEMNMKKYCHELGVKENHLLFCEILMQRPLKRFKGHLPNKLSDSDTAYMKQMAEKHFDRIIGVIRSLPKPMLLVFRNINTVRAITKNHGNPIDRYTIMAQVASKKDFKFSHHFIRKSIHAYWDGICFSMRLRWSAWNLRCTIWYIRFLGFIGRIANPQEVINMFS